MSVDLHSEVGSYVTDALDGPDRAAFEAHLLGCDHCRLEVAEFDETLAEFAVMAATAPPPSLRAGVLAGIREVRPLPPLDPREGLPGSEGSDQLEEPVPIGDLRPAQHAAQRGWNASPDWDGPVDELAERRAWRRTRILTLAVAATLVVALGLGGWVYSLLQQQRALTAQQQLADVNAQRERTLLAAPDAKVVSATKGSAVYSFVFSKERDEALFLGTGLGDPGSDKTYQLWTVQKAGVAPNALVGGFGKTQAWLDGEVGDAAGFAVSIEPAGGSTAPTQVQVQLPLP